MRRKFLAVLPAVLLIMASNLLAQDTTKTVPNLIPVIDGTYRLVSRFQVTDSTTVFSPDIFGMITYEKGYVNLIVAWHDPNGLVFSTSSISKFTLTDSTYTETLLYGYMHDEIHSQPIKYFFEPQTLTVPLKIAGTKISFKLPFDPPTQEFDGDKLTSTVKGLFIDHFERVK